MPPADAVTTVSAASFDATHAWTLHPRVGLRPEPFGALAYSYGNRRLTFLRDPELVALVASLNRYPSAEAALTASGIEARRHPAMLRSLAALAAAEVIDER